MKYSDLISIAVTFALFLLVIWTASSYDARHDRTLELLCAEHPEIECEAAP